LIELNSKDANFAINVKFECLFFLKWISFEIQKINMGKILMNLDQKGYNHPY